MSSPLRRAQEYQLDAACLFFDASLARKNPDTAAGRFRVPMPWRGHYALAFLPVEVGAAAHSSSTMLTACLKEPAV